ncbi:MAG: hypothetical protein AAFR35_10485 [Pseudomonadota bacterium]
MAKLQSRSAADLRTEIDRILETEPDADRAKAAVDAMLDVERLIIDRERAERDEERLERERRRFVNPILVALAAGVLAIAGDAYISQQQGRQELELARERAQSDLIRSAFVGEVDQTIANLNFMIDAGLIQDPGDLIINAARNNEPRETAPVADEPRFVPGVFDPPVSRLGLVERVSDGDTLLVRFDGGFGAGPRPRAQPNGMHYVHLAGADAAELRGIPGCGEVPDALRAIGQEARDVSASLEGERVRFLLVEVTGFGMLRAIVAPVTRAPDDAALLYRDSLNRSLLTSGLAIPNVGDRLPPDLWQQIQADARAAERDGRGMFDRVTRRVDLGAEGAPIAPPWLLKLVCNQRRNNIDPDTFFTELFERRRYEDSATGQRLTADDVIRIDGDVLTQTRPVHSFRIVNE